MWGEVFSEMFKPCGCVYRCGSAQVHSTTRHAGTTGSPVTTEQRGLELHPRAEGKEEAEEGTGVRDRGLVTNS